MSSIKSQAAYYLWNITVNVIECFALKLSPTTFLKTAFTWAGPAHASESRPTSAEACRNATTTCSAKECNFDRQLPRGLPTRGPLFPWKQDTQQVQTPRNAVSADVLRTLAAVRKPPREGRTEGKAETRNTTAVSLF